MQQFWIVNPCENYLHPLALDSQINGPHRHRRWMSDSRDEEAVSTQHLYQMIYSG
jgi:hypothetical protein